MTSKKFSTEYLTEDLDLPCSAKHDEIIQTSRWSEIHELVFEDPLDGTFWRTTYSRGLTEYQDERPFEDAGVEVEATQVELRPVTVEKWVAV